MRASYPVYSCGRCGGRTGWLGPEGFCADCMHAEQLHGGLLPA